MAEHTFFNPSRKGNERQIILRSATLLVGKAPTKQKRIKLKVSLPLTGKRLAGIPDWIVNAVTFVSQSHDIVSPVVDFKGFDIHFDDDQLFDSKGAKATKCQMRGFEIAEVGDSENPNVDMSFLIYAPFSRQLWRWVGEMAGEEMWAKFTPVDEPEPEDLELIGDEEEEESDEETETAED